MWGRASGLRGRMNAPIASPQRSSGRPSTATSGGRMAVEDLFDLGGEEILAAADDRILEPADDPAVAPLVSSSPGRPCVAIRRRAASQPTFPACRSCTATRRAGAETAASTRSDLPVGCRRDPCGRRGGRSGMEGVHGDGETGQPVQRAENDVGGGWCMPRYRRDTATRIGTATNTATRSTRNSLWRTRHAMTTAIPT